MCSATRAACWLQGSSFRRRWWSSSAASSIWTGTSSPTTRCGPRPGTSISSCAGCTDSGLNDRLREEAPLARSNEDLARRFVDACRQTQTILPATTTIERLCADALVDAERRIEARIAERIPSGLRRALEHLLNETVDAGVTRFVWLRQFEPGNNSADANRLLDRLEHLQRLDFPEGLFDDIPAHRITRLRRQGERYFADGLRELPENRRLAILAVCAVEWEMFLADAVVETHDRIVGRTYRTAVRTCEAQLGDETAAVREALRSFADLGSALLDARDTGAALDAVRVPTRFVRKYTLSAKASALDPDVLLDRPRRRRRPWQGASRTVTI